MTKQTATIYRLQKANGEYLYAAKPPSKASLPTDTEVLTVADRNFTNDWWGWRFDYKSSEFNDAEHQIGKELTAKGWLFLHETGGDVSIENTLVPGVTCICVNNLEALADIALPKVYLLRVTDSRAYQLLAYKYNAQHPRFRIACELVSNTWGWDDIDQSDLDTWGYSLLSLKDAGYRFKYFSTGRDLPEEAKVIYVKKAKEVRKLLGLPKPVKP